MSNTKTYLLLCLPALIVACNNNSSTEQQTGNFVDASISDFHNLGWLGAESHPLQTAISFSDPNDIEKSVSPGGLVLTKIHKESIADKAGLQIGDVIVGVNHQWLPIKDDPTLDLFGLLENQVSADSKSISIQVFRSGNCESFLIAHQLTSLDTGLPYRVARWTEAARISLDYLATHQNENGSLGPAEMDINDQLKLTALAGMAFLSDPSETYSAKAKACEKFIGDKIDELIAKEKKTDANQPIPPVAQNNNGQAKPKLPAGKTIIQIPSISMDPLTSAYLLMFLAESEIGMFDRSWMPRQMALFSSLSKSQDKSGGWDVDEQLAQEKKPDHQAAFTSSQILLALGMLERKGMAMAGNSSMIEKACLFLRQQKTLRDDQYVDRRLCGALDAASATALLSINCKNSDAGLTPYLDSAFANLEERHQSPFQSVQGMFSTSLLARQHDKQHWLKTQNVLRNWLVCVQEINGQFQAIPGETGSESNKGLHDHPLWTSAHLAVMLNMQHAQLKHLTCQITPQTMLVRNSDGKKAEGSAAKIGGLPPGVPAGANVIKLDIGDLQGGDLQEAIKKKLKEQCIDIGDAQLQGLGSGKKKADKKEKD